MSKKSKALAKKKKSSVILNYISSIYIIMYSDGFYWQQVYILVPLIEGNIGWTNVNLLSSYYKSKASYSFIKPACRELFCVTPSHQGKRTQQVIHQFMAKYVWDSSNVTLINVHIRDGLLFNPSISGEVLSKTKFWHFTIIFTFDL